MTTLTDTREIADPSLAPLFEPFRLTEKLELKNRIVLAPCTRNCADEGLVPTAGAIDYYRERADAGLLITEATLIRADCQGYRDTPGIWSDDQVRAWARVTDAVHQKDGLIFSQIWHVGRLAHPHYTGVDPVCPSSVPTEGRMHQTQGVELFHVRPRALEATEIPEIIGDYVKAARNAMTAGFDGVEIHGANGYLIDQFLRQHTNKRTDDWGGSTEKRARFALEVVDAVCDAVGSERVGLRISPAAFLDLDEFTEGDSETYAYVIQEMSKRNLAYLHTGIINDFESYDYLEGRPGAFIRRHYDGTLIGNGSYDAKTAATEVASGDIDLISFGKSFMANPDLVRRLRDDLPLNIYSKELLDTLK